MVIADLDIDFADFQLARLPACVAVFKSRCGVLLAISA